MIEFHLDNHSGVAPYLQIVQQVKQAEGQAQGDVHGPRG